MPRKHGGVEQSLIMEHDDAPQQSSSLMSSSGLIQHSPRLRTGRVGGLVPPPPRQRAKRMKDLLAEDENDSASGFALADLQVFVEDAHFGKVAVPVLSDFRDVLKVIDARERSLQNIKTFLASMCFIRGNSRSLPTGVLRRGRAKLARLLARHRAHSTLVVELIVKWRQRNAEPLAAVQPADELTAAGSLTGVVLENPLTARGTQARALPTRARASSHALPCPFSHPRPRTLRHPQGSPVLNRAMTSTMASAIATAAERAPPPAPPLRQFVAPATAEPFLWMGLNYLVKMAHDMKYSPLPIGSDPLLLSWFHYDIDRCASHPPLAASRHLSPAFAIPAFRCLSPLADLGGPWLSSPALAPLHAQLRDLARRLVLTAVVPGRRREHSLRGRPCLRRAGMVVRR